MKRIRKLGGILLLLLSVPLSACDYIDEVDVDNTTETSTSTTQAKRFSVTYFNYDDTFLYSCEVYEGGTAIYNGPTPTRPATEDISYTFNGWSGSESNIRSDRKLIATYSQTYIPLYSVNFVNYNGALLYSTTVREGKSATYVGDTPERPSTVAYEYTFIGWDKPLDSIYKDTTFVAQYSSKMNGLKVTFLNYDDSILDIQYTQYGFGVTYQGNTPQRPSDGEISYVFNGWDRNLYYITEDTEIHAKYRTVDTYCKVVFKNYDDTTLYEASVKYGQEATYPFGNPTRKSEGRFQYVFDGWDKDLTTVYRDMLVYAQFHQEIRELDSNFNYFISSNGAIINGYYGSDDDIYIPSTLDHYGTSYKIIAISDGTFSNKTSIRKLYIDENVKEIGESAFYGCYNLDTISLPRSLESVGARAFYGTKLKEVGIAENCKSIGAEAFPRSIESFVISPLNHYYKFENNILYNYNKTGIVYAFSADKNLVIPDGIASIGDSAFASLDIETLTIPTSVSTIGPRAFYNTTLKTVKIKDAACTIDIEAFNACYSLTNIDLGSKIVSIGDYCFCSNNAVSIQIPQSLMYLSTNAFINCTNLQAFEGASSNTFYPVKNGIIYTQSFSSIHTIPRRFSGVFYIPKNVTEFDFANYDNSYNITSFDIDSNNSAYFAYQNGIYKKTNKELFYVLNNTTTLELHPDTEYIADNLCNRYNISSNLKSVVFNSKLKQIGSYAFYSCYYATFNELPSTLTAIRSYAFYGCSGLTRATIGNSCTDIGDYAFYSSGLSVLTLGSKVSNIGTNAFAGTKITEVSIPNSVNKIGTYAFSNCTSLTTVTFGSSLTELPAYCFYLSNRLNSITLPYKLKTIGEYCFYGCSSLRTVSFPTSIQQIKDNAFYNTGLTQVLLKDTAINSLGTYAFGNCSSLTNVSLGNDLTYIPSYCFEGCSALKTITLPSNLTTINNYSFRNAGPTSFTTPYSLTTINSNAFNGSKVEALTIYSQNLSISSNAFQSSSSLKNILFSGGTAYCNNYSFAYLNSVDVEIASCSAYIYSYAFANSYVKTLKLSSSFAQINQSAFYSIENLILPVGKKDYINKNFATSVTNLFYTGTVGNYNYPFTIGTSGLVKNIYYYQATQPTDTTYKYWHYVDNVPTVWEVKTNNNN